jgi:hypothetical protein
MNQSFICLWDSPSTLQEKKNSTRTSTVLYTQCLPSILPPIHKFSFFPSLQIPIVSHYLTPLLLSLYLRLCTSVPVPLTAKPSCWASCKLPRLSVFLPTSRTSFSCKPLWLPVFLTASRISSLPDYLYDYQTSWQPLSLPEAFLISSIPNRFSVATGLSAILSGSQSSCQPLWLPVILPASLTTSLHASLLNYLSSCQSVWH